MLKRAHFCFFFLLGCAQLSRECGNWYMFTQYQVVIYRIYRILFFFFFFLNITNNCIPDPSQLLYTIWKIENCIVSFSGHFSQTKYLFSPAVAIDTIKYMHTHENKVVLCFVKIKSFSGTSVLLRLLPKDFCNISNVATYITQSAASYHREEKYQRRCAEKEGRNHSNPWVLALAEELRGVWLVLHSGGVQCLPEGGYKKTKEAAGHVEWLLNVSEHPFQIPCYQRHTLLYNTHNIQWAHTESWNSRVISALLLT